jgi:hypothetical protein
MLHNKTEKKQHQSPSLLSLTPVIFFQFCDAATNGEHPKMDFALIGHALLKTQ